MRSAFASLSAAAIAAMSLAPAAWAQEYYGTAETESYSQYNATQTYGSDQGTYNGNYNYNYNVNYNNNANANTAGWNTGGTSYTPPAPSYPSYTPPSNTGYGTSGNTNYNYNSNYNYNYNTNNNYNNYYYSSKPAYRNTYASPTYNYYNYDTYHYRPLKSLIHGIIGTVSSVIHHPTYCGWHGYSYSCY